MKFHQFLFLIGGVGTVTLAGTTAWFRMDGLALPVWGPVIYLLVIVAVGILLSFRPLPWTEHPALHWWVARLAVLGLGVLAVASGWPKRAEVSLNVTAAEVQFSPTDWPETDCRIGSKGRISAAAPALTVEAGDFTPDLGRTTIKRAQPWPRNGRLRIAPRAGQTAGDRVTLTLHADKGTLRLWPAAPEHRQPFAVRVAGSRVETGSLRMAYVDVDTDAPVVMEIHGCLVEFGGTLSDVPANQPVTIVGKVPGGLANALRISFGPDGKAAGDVFDVLFPSAADSAVDFRNLPDKVTRLTGAEVSTGTIALNQSDPLDISKLALQAPTISANGKLKMIDLKATATGVVLKASGTADTVTVNGQEKVPTWIQWLISSGILAGAWAAVQGLQKVVEFFKPTPPGGAGGAGS